MLFKMEGKGIIKIISMSYSVGLFNEHKFQLKMGHIWFVFLYVFVLNLVLFPWKLLNLFK